MSDVAVIYTLDTSGGTIVFNDGDLPSFDDMYFLTAARGLNGQAPMRTPQVDLPQAHGGRAQTFWKGARHGILEGEYLVQSTRVDSQIQIIRNQMAEALTTALDSIIQTTGTLTWTPAGLSERSLDVLSEVPHESDGVEQMTFSFGLYAANPSWS